MEIAIYSWLVANAGHHLEFVKVISSQVLVRRNCQEVSRQCQN